MNCLECVEILQKQLDGATAAREAVQTHLATCAECRERFAAADLLRGVMKLEPKPRPQLAVNFAQQMAARVVRDRLKRRTRLRRSLFITAALAASVLFVFLFSYWSQPSPVNPGPVAKQDDTKKPTPEVLVPEPRQDDTRQAFASYSERIVGTTREHARVLLTAANPLEQLPAGTLANLDPAAESLIEASRDVTDRVQTVTHSARRAFDYFAREIPMWDSSKGN